MIKLGNLNENHVMTVTVSSCVRKDDYDQILPRLEEVLAKQDKVGFFIKLEDVTGFEADALWEDIKFDVRHRKQYGRTAIVGDSKWQEWGTKIANLFFRAEMRFFTEDQAEQAWAWVNQLAPD
jgi:hypothetical protein